MHLTDVNHKMESMIETLMKALEKESISKFFKHNDAIKKHLKLKKHDIDELIEESYHFCKHKEWDKCKEALAYLIFFEPTRQIHYLRLGALLLQLNEFENALQIFEMASALNPHDPRPILYAADCFLELNRLEEAKTAFLCCIELSHNKPEYNDMYDLALQAIKDIKHL